MATKAARLSCRYLLQDISGSEGETAREDDRRFREHTAVRLARASDCQETLGRVGSLRQSPGLPVGGPLTAGHDGQLVTQGNREGRGLHPFGLAAVCEPSAVRRDKLGGYDASPW